METIREFRKIVEVHPLVLSKEDLLEFQTMIMRDFTNERDTLSVSLKFNGCVVSARSFESLFAEKLPASTDRMSVALRGWSSSGDIDKSLDISFYHNYANYQIFGADETWFLGTISKMNEFFGARMPWYGPVKRFVPFVCGALMGISLVSFVWAVVFGGIFAMLSSIALFGLSILVVVLDLKQILFPYVRIVLEPKGARRISYELITLIVAVITLIVTILGNIVLPLYLSSQPKP